MSSTADEHVELDEINVPHPHPSEEIDDATPSCMACRMGTWTRLVMLAFGLGPVLGSLVALVIALEGTYADFLQMEEVAWLSYPLLIPFFVFAAIMVYAALVVNNRRITTGSKAAWLLAIVGFGPIGIPAYWWVHVWRAPHLREPSS